MPAPTPTIPLYSAAAPSIVQAVCPHDCPDTCALHVSVQDGRVVRVAGDPEHPPTHPPTDADWDGMAANGFNVVRLIVSWSALEPERGQI
ncbi:MAG: hypothetical protein KJ023_09295, partial [Burkholderiaceae bacterium]|nr:hypothetical protein [Burkholderiaceae bacterium]